MNNTIVREIRGAKINPKSSFKFRVRKIRGGGNYASKYGVYFFPVAQQSNSGIGRLIFEVITHSKTHTYTHTRQDSSGRMISSSQRPLPIQQTTHIKDEHSCHQCEIRFRKPSNETAADLHRISYGHQNRRTTLPKNNYGTALITTAVRSARTGLLFSVHLNQLQLSCYLHILRVYLTLREVDKFRLELGLCLTDMNEKWVPFTAFIIDPLSGFVDETCARDTTCPL